MILTIPPEVLLRLLSDLDALTLIRLKHVCRYLYDIITSDVSLIYKVELYHVGMADDPTVFTTLSISERLQKLRTFLQRRQEVFIDHWKEKTVTQKASLIGTYSSGLFVRRVQGAFWFMHLGTVWNHWNYRVSTTEYRGFRVDYNQNLLLVMDFVEGHICFRPCGAQDGKQHPLARVPYFLGQGEDARWDTVSLFEDVIATMIPDDQGAVCIEILNWKQGITVTSIDIRDVDHCAFTFVDSSHLLLWCHNEEDITSELRVYELPDTNAASQPKLALILPIAKIPGKQIEYLGGIFSNGYRSIPPQHRRVLPFRSSNDDAVIALLAMTPWAWSAVLVFPRSGILSLLDKRTSFPTIVEWGTWPQWTLYWHSDSPSKIRAHGSRVGINSYSLNDISIYEFSGRRFSKNASPLGGPVGFPPPIESRVGALRDFELDDDLLAVDGIDGNLTIGKVYI
ncbi:hypothetical protein BDN72DRAFT_251776 [Pluteus cervinus]|uniref:Uncharacterized protein n=1 Tax=Pluteus cervinus TaxID=181527 RepID=A0ACD3AIW1_9AGAR|nr:hypothetical protein BDN72DRAFT_251776 [Pluteus cervinus]